MVNFVLIPFLAYFFILTLIFPENWQAYADTGAAETNVGSQNEKGRKERIKVAGEDLTGMGRIPTGTFIRGSTQKEIGYFYELCRKVDKNCRRWWLKDEAPRARVDIDGYWIDIFEVTNEQYLEFVLAAGHRPALDENCETKECRDGNLWKGTEFPDSISRQPVAQVSWYDAAAYCEWRGKRLPTEAEWEKAARGIQGNLYPWGSELPPGKATYRRKWRGEYTMTDVGSYSNGVSVYGVYDMAGNVWEWVADWYDRGYYRRGVIKNPKGPSEGEFKSVRGGSWVNYADALHSAFRRWSRPEVRFNDTGFRCARDIKENKK